jgi:hypothetical protein
VLQNELGDAVWFPSLAFSAYHPDLILISDPTRGNQLVNCATGSYHSALALFAYRAGWPAEAALRLYRREVFAALGYFQVWRGAAEALLDQGRQFGLDLSADFLRWANRGCFMYSINHPKPHVLYDIARKLLRYRAEAASRRRADKRADRLRHLCGRRYRARLRLPGLSRNS